MVDSGRAAAEPLLWLFIFQLLGFLAQSKWITKSSLQQDGLKKIVQKQLSIHPYSSVCPKEQQNMYFGSYALLFLRTFLISGHLLCLESRDKHQPVRGCFVFPIKIGFCRELLVRDISMWHRRLCKRLLLFLYVGPRCELNSMWNMWLHGMWKLEIWSTEVFLRLDAFALALQASLQGSFLVFTMEDPRKGVGQVVARSEPVSQGLIAMSVLNFSVRFTLNLNWVCL